MNRNIIDSIRRTLKNLHSVSVTKEQIEAKINELCPNGYQPSDRENIIKALIPETSAMVPATDGTTDLALPQQQQNNLANTPQANIQVTPVSTPLDTINIQAQEKAETIGAALNALTDYELKVSNIEIAKQINAASQYRNQQFTAQDSEINTAIQNFYEQNRSFFRDSTSNILQYLGEIKRNTP